MNATVTSDWTATGHQLDFLNDAENGALVYSVRSREAWLRSGTYRDFVLGRLVVLTGVTQSDAMRQVKHWLAFFDDPELTSFGLRCLRETYESLEHGAPPATADAPAPAAIN